MSNTEVVLRDKKGRRIMPGDVVKVLHFVTKRRKHYMYKIVHLLEGHFYAAHAHKVYVQGVTLNNSYALPRQSTILEDYEIVEGYNGGDYESRR